LILNQSSNIKRSLLNIIINTNDGSFDSIVGDHFCDGNCPMCLDGQCFDNYSDATKDMVVYVCWAGVDADKK